MEGTNGELTQIKTHPYDRELARIKNFLKGSSKGYTVTEISHAIDINRNSVAKYLDVLCISGAVELKVIGSAKIYTLTKRIPISSILSLSSDYLFVLDDEFVVTYVNEHVLNFEKRTSDDIVGKSVDGAGLLLLSLPDIDTILKECTQGKDILKEIDVANDGKTWYFRAKFVPSILENGKRGILIILDDISEIKQYQRDLEKTVSDRTKELTQTSTTLKKEIKSHREVRNAFEDSERKYQTLIELAQEGIWTFDAEGNTSFVNQKMSEILGWSADEMLGKSIVSCTAANDRAYLDEKLARIKTGKSEHFDLVFLKKDQTPVYTRLSASPRMGEKGKFIYGLFVVSDVTALKKADDALVESELHYRTIIETSPNGILVLDLEGIIRLGNIQAATMLGYATTGDLTGKNFFDYVTPNDLDNSRAHLKKTLEKGFSKYYECRLISKDNTAFCAEVSVSTIPDHTGRPSGFVCVLSDVTEQRKADYLVRKSEEKHRSLVEGISHIIFTTDTKGRFTYVSPVIRQVLGYSSAELMGKYIYTLVPSGERHVLGEKLKEAQRGILSPNDFEMVDKSGGIHWGRIIAQPLIEGEKITGITGLIGDITDLRHSEQALRESEEKLKLAIEGSGVGLWDWRVQSGEMVINDRWAEILGYTVQELAPVTIDTWRSLTHPDDLQRSDELLRKHFSGEAADFACESRMKHKDGHWIWVLDRGMVTEWDKAGKPLRMTGTHLNISERKSAEEALRQVNRKLNLLSSLTRHDILNKVSVLLGYLDKAKTLAQDATLLDYLDRMDTSTKAIGKLVKFTRDYKDLGINPPRWIALKDCMNEVTEWIDPNVVRLTLEVADWEIYADPQVTRVFRNIFENARIHGEHVTEIFVEARKNDRGLEVIIGDNGIGILLENKQEIFEPGMMRNRGLGLFLAKEILSITGLTIEENGVPGKGARFVIHIPLECFRVHQAPAGEKKKVTSVPEAAP
jgi:PAS domain S-box-containing protein